ncbi:hypothetical protein DV711_11015 [Motiliproteus coralliicola]|uniref:Uncharacterized protein n=1 Tax=Motiliproteus coralliicola TaxID=2283196 RepID=A0A369WE50_9GAMM|nr:hypothetical protein [Motiliproteus coralliicola]RDE19419.1 hypothetical protein DV711_11015 [Motiliproteus coralliicola]
MKLYKFTPSLEIAERISVGIFRFYELTKYIKMEDEVGRSDSEECSVGFPRKEYEAFPEKLPTGSFRGIEFKCIRSGNDEEYIKQYFVFCMSTKSDEKAIGDSKYIVELYKDNFDLFMQLLNEPYEDSKNPDGRKFFSHGEVEYYDIHNHPKPIVGEFWREVYLKHAEFEYQSEYRAAFFVSDHFFNRVRDNPMVIEKKIYHKDKAPMDFNLELYVQSGIDDEGWRFLEIDISKFAANISPDSSNIIGVTESVE